MNYLKDLKEQFTFDQLLLIFTCFSFTFPVYIFVSIKKSNHCLKTNTTN